MLGNQECNKNIFNIQQEGGILVTKDKYKGLIPTGHAAIIYTKNSVIESLSKGVPYVNEREEVMEIDHNTQKIKLYKIGRPGLFAFDEKDGYIGSFFLK